MKNILFPTINDYLREKFGERVQKIPLDAGFTCPNRDGTKGFGGCIYCDHTGSGTGKSKSLTIKEQMEQGIIWAKKKYNAKKFIAYFQAFSNTYHNDVNYLRDLFCESIVSDEVVGISIGTRPDCINEKILKMLSERFKDKFLILELGLQSAHDKTLKKINRCHSLEDFDSAVQLINRFGIPICVHIIFGLPDESTEDMKKTILYLKEKEIHGIKFHNLYIHKNTILEKYYQNGLYTPISQEAYANLVAWSIRELLPKNIIIHRLTGDPHPQRLVAPTWAMEKNITMKMIHQKFKELT